MIKAYKLESKAAMYPRILIDGCILDLTSQNYRSVFFQQDMDGLWFTKRLEAAKQLRGFGKPNFWVEFEKLHRK